MLPQYFNPNIMPPMLSTADVTTQGCRLLSDDSAFSQRIVQEKMKTKEESRKLHQKKTLGRVEEEKAGEEEREKRRIITQAWSHVPVLHSSIPAVHSAPPRRLSLDRRQWRHGVITWLSSAEKLAGITGGAASCVAAAAAANVHDRLAGRQQEQQWCRERLKYIKLSEKH